LEQTVVKKKRVSKSLFGFSLKRRNQTYIFAENTAVTWRKTTLKKLKTNQKIKKTINQIEKLNQTIAK